MTTQIVHCKIVFMLIFEWTNWMKYFLSYINKSVRRALTYVIYLFIIYLFIYVFISDIYTGQPIPRKWSSMGPRLKTRFLNNNKYKQ